MEKNIRLSLAILNFVNVYPHLMTITIKTLRDTVCSN